MGHNPQMSVRGCGVSSPWQWPPDEGRVARSNPADGAQYLTSGPFAIVEPEGLAMYADQSVDDDAPHTPERFRTTESYTHWDRGLAIVAGIIGIVLLFVLLLTNLPIRAGTGARRTGGARRRRHRARGAYRPQRAPRRRHGAPVPLRASRPRRQLRGDHDPPARPEDRRRRPQPGPPVVPDRAAGQRQRARLGLDRLPHARGRRQRAARSEGVTTSHGRPRHPGPPPP